MSNSTSELTKSYYIKQCQRTIKVLERIRSKGNVASGRAIPDSDDIAIHTGRRITATVMFLDISRFSSRASSTEEEQLNLLQILSLFFTEMIKVIEDYGGVVEKNTGDGLMAYFVRDSSSATSAQQNALAAALTMFSATVHLINPVISNSHMEPLDFRICMDHGPITIAKVGAARGFNGIVAIGATANVANKMLAVADPNTILLGDRVIEGLPQQWCHKYLNLKSSDTGWIYTVNGAPYCFWQYEGRWRLPV